MEEYQGSVSSTNSSRGNISVDQVDDNSSISGYSHALVHPTDYSSVFSGWSSTASGWSSTASGGHPTLAIEGPVDNAGSADVDLVNLNDQHLNAQSIQTAGFTGQGYYDAGSIVTLADVIRYSPPDASADSLSTTAQGYVSGDASSLSSPLSGSSSSVYSLVTEEMEREEFAVTAAHAVVLSNRYSSRHAEDVTLFEPIYNEREQRLMYAEIGRRLAQIYDEINELYRIESLHSGETHSTDTSTIKVIHVHVNRYLKFLPSVIGTLILVALGGQNI